MEREKNNYGRSKEAERKIRVVEFHGAEKQAVRTERTGRHGEDATYSGMVKEEEFIQATRDPEVKSEKKKST